MYFWPGPDSTRASSAPKGRPCAADAPASCALPCAQVSVYVSFYVEATNRDAYMAIKQDLLLAFIDCVERNAAKLAKQLLLVRPGPSMDIGRSPQAAELTAASSGTFLGCSSERETGLSRVCITHNCQFLRGARSLQQCSTPEAAYGACAVGQHVLSLAQVEVVAQALPSARGAATAGAAAPADTPPGGPGGPPHMTLPEGRGQQGPSVEVSPSAPGGAAPGGAQGGAAGGRGGRLGRRGGRRVQRGGPGRRQQQRRAARRPYARAAAPAGACLADQHRLRD